MSQAELILPDEAQMRFILESAIHAPSADNQHRIRFEVDGNILLVRLTDVALPPKGGYKRVLMLISLGALAENLAIAASRFGLEAVIDFLPADAPSDCVVRVGFKNAGSERSPLCSQIPLRHTNRSMLFRGPGLADEDKEELQAGVPRFAGVNLHWLDVPARRRQAVRLMRFAEALRFRARLLHEELFSAIRFEIGWKNSCAEGLPPGALGVEKPLRPFFAMMRHWPLMRFLNLFGAHRILGWRAGGLPAWLAPNLGVIAVEAPDDQSICAAGRAFQRLWLDVTRRGLVLQPLPASALYALDGARQEGVAEQLWLRLRQGWRSLLPAATPLMLFRVGRAAKPAVNTGRKPLASYFADESDQ